MNARFYENRGLRWSSVGNQTDSRIVGARGMVDGQMSQPIVGKSVLDTAAEDVTLQSQEALPPYELDPAFDNLAVRKRIGEVIAKPVGQRIPKRETGRRHRVGRQ
jgi:hypothetical protein